MMLDERARAVQTREDLVTLLAELRVDLERNPEAWANSNLTSFLEAMAAWVQDMEAYYRNTGQKLSDLSPWKLLADVLLAARAYE
jgi:hypothetical protein